MPPGFGQGTFGGAQQALHEGGDAPRTPRSTRGLVRAALVDQQDSPQGQQGLFDRHQRKNTVISFRRPVQALLSEHTASHVANRVFPDHRAEAGPG